MLSIINHLVKNRLPLYGALYKNHVPNLQPAKFAVNYCTGDKKGGKKPDDKTKKVAKKPDTPAKSFAEARKRYEAKIDTKIVSLCVCPPEAPAAKPPPSAVNRIKRLEPGKVIIGVIPVEWATFFHSRTGVTGFYTFCFTFSIYLMSKEKYVMEHEYYGGISMAITCWFAVKYLGPSIAKWLDKEMDEFEDSFNKGRVLERKSLEEQIEDEFKLQESCEGQLMLLDAKRENVRLQYEAIYRERKMNAFLNVKRILDYNLELELIGRRIAHLNMIQWVRNGVIQKVKDDHEHYENVIDKCLADLTALIPTQGKSRYGGSGAAPSSAAAAPISEKPSSKTSTEKPPDPTNKPDSTEKPPTSDDKKKI